MYSNFSDDSFVDNPKLAMPKITLQNISECEQDPLTLYNPKENCLKTLVKRRRKSITRAVN
jgi:hypothetical protein